MEGRQEGILDDTQELTTENMPENQPGDQPEAELMGQPEKTPENTASNEPEQESEVSADGRDETPAENHEPICRMNRRMSGTKNRTSSFIRESREAENHKNRKRSSREK